MKPSGIVTLLSDFGLADTYVGVMKGAIAQINPALTVIDLTHQIPPQNIAAARFALLSAIPYFPVGTVHLAVVDPGVGSQRRAIAVILGDTLNQPFSLLVGPDNGLFSHLVSPLGNQYPILTAVELTNSQYWRTTTPSSTFHGRDVFAPVAAHLATGVAMGSVGEEIAPDTLVKLDLLPVQQQQLGADLYKVTGVIQTIDHFGNLVTNIPASAVMGKLWLVRTTAGQLHGRQTYSNVPPGNLLALIGSHGWVEIAVNGGNAHTQLKLDWGATVEILVSDGEIGEVAG